MNRRGFFKLIAGAALVPVLPYAEALEAPIAPSGVPKLWADGIHDDAPALNALFRGDVFEWAGLGDIPAHAIRHKSGELEVVISRGTYLLQETIKAERKDDKLLASIMGARIIIDHEGCVMSCGGPGRNHILFDTCSFEFSKPVKRIIMESLDAQPEPLKDYAPTGAYNAKRPFAYRPNGRITSYQRGRA